MEQENKTNPQMVNDLTPEQKHQISIEKEEMNKAEEEVIKQLEEGGEVVYSQELIPNNEPVVEEKPLFTTNDLDEEVIDLNNLNELTDEDGILVRTESEKLQETTNEVQRVLDEAVAEIGEREEGVKNAHLNEDFVSTHVDPKLQQMIRSVEDWEHGLNLPSGTLNNTILKFNALLNEATSTNNAKLLQQTALFFGSLSTTTDGSGVDQDFFNEEGVVLDQGFKFENDKVMGISSVPTSTGAKGSDLIKEAAVIKAIRFLKIGDVVRVPLPHSGIWVTMKPPTELEFVHFYTAMSREKTRMGRETYGFTFNNSSVDLNEDYYDFIQSKIIGTNVKGLLPSDLKRYLNIHDLRALQLGLIAAVYPNGFYFKRACNSKVVNCTHILEEMLNIHKLLWVNRARMSDTQRKLFNNFKANSLTLEDIETYRLSNPNNNKSVEIKGVKVYFNVPTLEVHFEEGQAWINDVTFELDKITAGNALTEEEETEKLNQLNKSTSILNWVHFVTKLELDGDTVTNRKAIRETLVVLSADDVFYKEFEKKLFEFRNASIIADVGIPTYECPACQGLNEARVFSPSVEHVIPLDVSHLFFLMFIIRFHYQQVELETN